MENLRKLTKRKLAVMLSSMSLPIIIVIVMAVSPFDFSGQETSLFERFPPLPYILAVLVEAYLAFKNIKYYKVLKDDDYAKYYMIKKNDERNRMIRLYTNALVHKIFIYILCVVLIAAAFVREDLFYSCLGLGAAFLIVHIVVYTYYSRKY